MRNKTHCVVLMHTKGPNQTWPHDMRYAEHCDGCEQCVASANERLFFFLNKCWQRIIGGCLQQWACMRIEQTSIQIAVQYLECEVNVAAAIVVCYSSIRKPIKTKKSDLVRFGEIVNDWSVHEFLASFNQTDGCILQQITRHSHDKCGTKFNHIQK